MAELLAPRTLILLRHAKSDRTGTGIDDAARPLTERGVRAAKSIGHSIRQSGPLPDLVLCSPARRAQDTWKIVRAELDPAPPATTVPELYDFGNGDALLDVIHQHGGTARTLMLVGHNPSIEELATRLTGSGNTALRNRLETKFPTAALAIIVLPPGNWTSTSWKSGELTSFICPRDLQED
jgi:phosphohistidine phosphatase